MTDKACYVCDRGADRAVFCDNCTDNFNNGRIDEAMYDLGLSLLRELRIMTGAEQPPNPKMMSFKVEIPAGLAASSVSHRWSVRWHNLGPQKIKAIKEIRSITGKGLKESKEIVDNLTTFDIPHATVLAMQSFKQTMENIGCDITINPDPGP